MSAYATAEDVAAGFRTLTDAEVEQADALLSEAGVIIDAYNAEASDEAKMTVSVRIVRRALASAGAIAPMGSTQGSQTAGPYSQSWTISGGATGEIYLGRLEKKLLGVGDRIGSHSPLEDMAGG